MSITYYYAPMSTAVRTTWAIEELGVPCERVKLDISKKQTKAAAFLKLNPNGLVPLARRRRDADLRVHPILIYLGETYGVDKGLYPPPGPRARRDAQVARLGERRPLRAAEPVGPQHGELGPRRAAQRQGGRGRQERPRGRPEILDDALAGKTCLVDDRFSLANLAASSYLGWAQHMGYDLSPFKNVKAWANRCLGRPAAAKANSES